MFALTIRVLRIKGKKKKSEDKPVALGCILISMLIFKVAQIYITKIRIPFNSLRMKLNSLYLITDKHFLMYIYIFPS